MILESVPAGPPDQSSGDLWLLGEHRVYAQAHLIGQPMQR